MIIIEHDNMTEQLADEGKDLIKIEGNIVIRTKRVALPLNSQLWQEVDEKIEEEQLEEDNSPQYQIAVIEELIAKLNNSVEQLRADTDYIAIMSGVEL